MAPRPADAPAPRPRSAARSEELVRLSAVARAVAAGVRYGDAAALRRALLAA